jgi:pimeloyl-ACP methyl ester carboxylesterase
MMVDFSVALADAQIVGDRRGSGKHPLVLIHGFGGSRYDWDTVCAGLPPELSLLRYDQRGFGDSGLPLVPYSHADDLAALLDSLGIAKADVCGMSLGGGTALSFALDRPHRVRRLVLVSPLIAGWNWSEDWVARWKAIGRNARNGDMEGARALWLDHPLFAQVRGTSEETTLRQSVARFHGQQWIEDPAKPALPDVERLHELSVPTLLLTGERDMADFRSIAHLIAGTAPHVERLDFKDAGHMLPLERPGSLARAISKFLAAE